MGEILRAKVTQNFSGKFGGLRAKILRTGQNLPAPTLMSRGCPKIFLQRGQSRKISFSPLETEKTIFFANNLMGKCQISKPWGLCPHLRRPCP